MHEFGYAPRGAFSFWILPFSTGVSLSFVDSFSSQSIPIDQVTLLIHTIHFTAICLHAMFWLERFTSELARLRDASTAIWLTDVLFLSSFDPGHGHSFLRSTISHQHPPFLASLQCVRGVFVSPPCTLVGGFAISNLQHQSCRFFFLGVSLWMRLCFIAFMRYCSRGAPPEMRGRQARVSMDDLEKNVLVFCALLWRVELLSRMLSNVSWVSPQRPSVMRGRRAIVSMDDLEKNFLVFCARCCMLTWCLGWHSRSTVSRPFF